VTHGIGAKIAPIGRLQIMMCNTQNLLPVNNVTNAKQKKKMTIAQNEGSKPCFGRAILLFRRQLEKPTRSKWRKKRRRK